MSNINPLNFLEKPKNIVEKIDKGNDFSKKKRQGQESEDEYREIEKKINDIITNKNLINALENADIEDKIKILAIVENSNNKFLKKELLELAKQILNISFSKEEEEIFFESETDISSYLAKYLIKYQKSKNNYIDTKNFKKPNPLEDRNAGFLVHYCNDILNKSSNNVIKPHKLEKLSKSEANKLSFNNKK
ncbi:MAG: hypothetical protein A2888_03020 [Chlamydiae bacterium RIFCSPLOWO2_01_FULL_28_7]|nr:MAG: hypothetical protein A2888_03020 [Chlamydiae bacterium RIFCSPLOWO2_01_FULL_28_7]